MQTNVADRFMSVFGDEPDILKEAPIESPVGQACIRVIEAARVIVDALDEAFGTDDHVAFAELSNTVRAICEVYIRG